jgi:phosphoglycerol transferase MdoB-like AlkP superfamily enzyme
MITIHGFLKPLFKGSSLLRLLSISLFLAIAVAGWVLERHASFGLYYILSLSYLCLRFPSALSQLMTLIARHPWFHQMGGFRTVGTCLGTFLFWNIISHAQPAQAQIFDTVEDEVDRIFGEYLEGDTITFLFGLIRVVIWISAIGFVFFAIYQAQRGEQWQPLAQNAFIIVAAVVLVEGLSALFFGEGVGGGGGDGAEGGGGEGET